ncbi:MAG: TolC family protein [Spirochaetaceae bacterium]|nr:MAG: TolC family protein [Spirochaetaceae bacterium]
MKRVAPAFTLACTILAVGLTRLPAQEQRSDDQPPTLTLSVQEIARRAQSRNLEIFKAARSVERAREELIGEPELMDSTLSVGGGYTTGGVGGGGWSGQSSLSLPVFPQLSFGGEVSVDDAWQLGEEVSLSVKPLAPKRQTYSEEKDLESALVRERYLKRRIFLDAERAGLNLLVRDMERELIRSTEELEQKKYELARRRQEVGETSFQDVQDQLVDLIEAREDMFNSEQRYLSDWRTLQLLFAPSEERIAVSPLSFDDLLDLVEARRAKVEGFEDIAPVTEKLEVLQLDLAALEAELKATRGWRPDLNLSTAVTFPYEFPESHSVNMSLSFSPNQLKQDEREDLRQDIEIKRMEIAAESYAADMEKSLQQQNIALVDQALASAQIQGERDRVALQEGELLFQRGRRTTLELEQLRLNLRRTQILIFQSAAEVYRVLGVYLLLFVSEGSG